MKKARKPKPKMLAPCECKTVGQQNRLVVEFRVDVFSIRIGGKAVGIGNGLSCIWVDGKSFNKLIAWYQKKQKVRK